ncbi:tetratricopeptide repeat protein [Undibacterium sp. SXout7W]|uniref:tetratricopeptide repeat protein n=1 Tax=Undibacterium sp. SXout7W TaxID=3413049 RepID=UPI003BF1A44A
MRILITYAGLIVAVVMASACHAPINQQPTTAEIESTGQLAMHGQQSSALRSLTVWSEQGQVTAQRELGLALAAQSEQNAHAVSMPVQQVQEAQRIQAVHWLTQAAKGGDAEARFELAEVYYKARLGVQKDAASAWQWYEAAALQGHSKASFMLARMSKYGEGVPLSLNTSVHWLQKSADQGNAQAMFLLSNAYASGEGVAQDAHQAREWLERSADGDFPVAIQALAMELDGKVNTDPDAARRSRHLIKEASDERLLRWNKYQ